MKDCINKKCKAYNRKFAMNCEVNNWVNIKYCLEKKESPAESEPAGTSVNKQSKAQG